MEIQQKTTDTANNKRAFITGSFDANNWAAIEPYFKLLNDHDVKSVEDLHQWLRNWSELDAAISENNRWVYVRTTIDTSDEVAKKDLTNIYTNVFPHISAYTNKLNRKFVDCAFTAQLDPQVFNTTIRRIKKSIELFREENIPLQAELNIKQSRFDEITGAQSIHYNGAELTFQQASVYLRNTDRKIRREVYDMIQTRRKQDATALDDLLTELIAIRHKIALNAGYKNYMEYKFDSLGRFDYTPNDCLNFHASVEKTVMPLLNELAKKRKEQLGVDALRPWDAEVDTSGKAPLQPFTSSKELVEKTIACFEHLDPYFAHCIKVMQEINFLDLESRMNKGAGGYNMTMPEKGVPFIFMNSANSEHDLITIVHEGGHAVHTFLSHPLELNIFKEVPSEIAEVASMGMELLSMEYWDVFYSNPDDLARARRNHLKYIPNLLAKTCLGDSFQFWLYLNPEHTVEERRNKWVELNRRFTPAGYDWTGYEDVLATGYNRILHFYEVPFYYIEYAFAQLGALGLWKSFKQNHQAAIDNYKKALSMGYTRPIPEFYKAVGTTFDFSEQHVASLIDFLNAELLKLG